MKCSAIWKSTLFVMVILGFAACGDEEAKAEEGDTIAVPIKCDRFYNLYTNCQVQGVADLFAAYEVQLDDEVEKVHSRFTFEYSFNCSDRDLPLLWQAGETQIHLKSNSGWTSLALEGRGDLKVVQSEESRQMSETQYFNQTCEIILRNLVSEPSLKTIQEWRTTHADIASRLTDAASALDKINKLILYQEALDFINHLAEMFLEELGSDARQALSAESQNILGDLDAMLSDSVLNLPENHKQSLLKLREIIAVLPNDSRWHDANGEPLTIADFLSPEDRQTIKTILTQRETPQSLLTQRNDLMFRMNGWSERLVTLNNLLQQWETVPL